MVLVLAHSAEFMYAQESKRGRCPMTFYNLLMSFGFVVMIAVMAKGFCGITRVKPLEQPDNPQSDAAPPT
ncbi:hypothetical protein LCM4573_23925 [Rhizobium sp. LCM 4573]|nr:hypothetical protein LCM4573_23925 [Rhizobium sp. LCM 4573]